MDHINTINPVRLCSIMTLYSFRKNKLYKAREGQFVPSAQEENLEIFSHVSSFSFYPVYIVTNLIP